MAGAIRILSNFALMNSEMLIPPLPRRFSWRGFLRLIRLGNLLIIAFTQYCLKFFLIDAPGLPWAEKLADGHFFLLSLATVMVAAAGYIINDYYDVKIDLINKPERVVIGKLVKRRVAMGANIVINVLALGIAAYLGWRVLLTIFVSIFLLWWYSNRLKRMPLIGNLTIAVLTALTLFIVVIYTQVRLGEIYIYASFAFFITLIREIIKDMEDVKGDASFGCYTLPIAWGIRRTKLLIYALIVSFISNLAVSFFFLAESVVAYLALVIFFPIAWLIVRLYQADRVRDFRFLSHLCKAIMLIGVLSMVFFR